MRWPEFVSSVVELLAVLSAVLSACVRPPPRTPRPAFFRWPFSLSFALHVAPSSLAFRLPARSLCASVFRPRLLLFLSRCPPYCSSCCIRPHPRFAPLVGPAAAAAPTAPAASVVSGPSGGDNSGSSRQAPPSSPFRGRPCLCSGRESCSRRGQLAGP